MVYVLGCLQVSNLSQKQYKFYVDGIIALDDLIVLPQDVGRKFIVYTRTNLRLI